jgi:hypothetical protein
MGERITTYAEFWPFYLRQHTKSTTRFLHYIGTVLAIVLLSGFLAKGSVILLLAAIVAGYLFAWAGHYAVERNRPATFTYPFWSLVSDFRMFFLWLTGGLEEELRKAGVDSD